MKRILICLDGTWNESGAAAGKSDTNVFRLFQSAEHFKTPNQVSFYSPGVGTKFLEKIRGGVFGYGLYEQIKEGYLHVAETYQPGDQVIVAGFSRGAFSARSLASFLVECGVLKDPGTSFFSASDQRSVDHLWELYRNRHEDPDALRTYCSKNCHPPTDTLVGAVAVWDTVGALGVPWEMFSGSRLADLAQERENKRLGFLNTRLSPRIARAYHAVALDEQRVPFLPTLWDDPRVATGEIQQVWFAGAHANVGGGFSNRGLSDICLDWMIRQLRKHHGLNLRDAPMNPDAVWEEVGKTDMDQKAAKVDGRLVDTLRPREVPPNSLIHPTAITRQNGDARHSPIVPAAKINPPFRIADH